jgi:hypothetical protein
MKLDIGKVSLHLGGIIIAVVGLLVLLQGGLPGTVISSVPGGEVPVDDLTHGLGELLLFAVLAASLFTFWQIGVAIKPKRLMPTTEGVRRLLYLFYLADIMLVLFIGYFVYLHTVGFHLPLWFVAMVFAISIAIIVMLMYALEAFPTKRRR